MKLARFYSETEMDLESHRCIVNKQNVFLFLCVRVYGCHAAHILHSSNNHFPKASLFDYKSNKKSHITTRIPSLIWLFCSFKLQLVTLGCLYFSFDTPPGVWFIAGFLRRGTYALRPS